MKCYQCKAWAEVLETRTRSDGVTRRRYECANTHRFTTLEVVVQDKKPAKKECDE